MNAPDTTTNSLFRRARSRFGAHRSSLGRRSARRGLTARILAAVAAAGAGLLVPTAARADSPSVHTAALSNYPIVAMAPTPDAQGFWMAASDGGLFSFGDAGFHGSLGGIALSKPIVGMAGTPDGGGYWMVASDGGVFSFGDAGYYGSLGGIPLNRPIVGIARTPDGRGYWLVASDGGIFSFGDASFFGSTGAVALTKPVVGMAPTPDGRGYWLVASDGGIFSYGDSGFHGSTGGVPLSKPIVGMAASPDGGGYWLVASDGGLFTFGDATFHGSAVGSNAATGASSVGVMAVGSGYWIPNNQGQVASLGAPPAPSPSSPLFTSAAPSVAALPAGTMPGASVDASDAQKQACWVANANPGTCNAAALADVNRARAGEGLGPLSLPGNFYSLSTTGQLLAVANAERTSRGLPAMGENVVLDTLAAAGALAGLDPTGPSGYTWGSNIAWGDPTPLAADFGWMYDDGPNSPNIDCTSASSSGCWGHRKNILAPWGGSAGTGVYINNGTIQLTQLFVKNY